MKNMTDYVSTDEPCWGYFELEFQSPDNKGFHRYQIIEVIRNGQVAEYRRDMGLAKKIRDDGIRIPCFLVHTVGEAKEMADWMRSHSRYDKCELAQVSKVRC